MDPDHLASLEKFSKRIHPGSEGHGLIDCVLFEVKCSKNVFCWRNAQLSEHIGQCYRAQIPQYTIIREVA